MSNNLHHSTTSLGTSLVSTLIGQPLMVRPLPPLPPAFTDTHKNHNTESNPKMSLFGWSGSQTHLPKHAVCFSQVFLRSKLLPRLRGEPVSSQEEILKISPHTSEKEG